MFDLAEEYRVIAPVERFEKAALECAHRTVQDRNAVLVDGEIDIREFVIEKGREMFGNACFVGRQYINGEPARLLECVVAAGRFFDADQDERRVERDGAKGRYGDAVEFFGGIFGRHDGDAARESGHGGAEIGGGHGHRLTENLP